MLDIAGLREQAGIDAATVEPQPLIRADYAIDRLRQRDVFTNVAVEGVTSIAEESLGTGWWPNHYAHYDCQRYAGHAL